MELHLVPDTNLFFEFRTLEQLPWEELGFDPIVLLLTKPVLDEIDKHKKGSGRTRDRALDIFGRFRSMLTQGVQDASIRTSGPHVVLRRMTSVLPDPAYKDHLDYAKADERLIGIVSELNKEASGYEVKLFTDDGGPAGMALDLGIPFLMIDQSWRRPPAETTEAKQIRELKKDLEAYRDLEPKIAIRCETADANRFVKVIGKVAKPLKEEEVAQLIELLLLKHPIRTDFTPPPSVTTVGIRETKTVEYSAPTEEEIATYRDVRYPEWIKSCREILTNFHFGRDEDAPPAVLQWTMSNEGSRPASRVRVEFATSGPLALMRGGKNDDVEDEDKGSTVRSSPSPVTRLPSPPQPPAFRETVTCEPLPASNLEIVGRVPLSSLRGVDIPKQYQHALDAAKRLATSGAVDVGALKRFQDSMLGITAADAAMRASLANIVAPTITPISQFSLPPYLRREPHNPEEFYYSSWPKSELVRSGAQTCDLWRHQTSDHFIEFEVLFEGHGDVRGVVECSVHAENLTTPQQLKVVVERNTVFIEVFDLAMAMIECGN
ncbi:PIN domain-containing protein [Rhodopseudomonas palustris]|uniref:PIN domain-containing protein n=1 Tax=Rhodopseudomonas palustris TaxID=1076 RepID=UPI000E5B108B|nr:PIN domain-containing protein [Rhodopseudomonas palustris]QLH71843.1 hypothetical protein HZF03_14020 [Rhodopseudomonas palustris]RIA01051.1 hypothetical protein D1920_12685 [Rhodopseudomonas palustris]